MLGANKSLLVGFSATTRASAHAHGRTCAQMFWPDDKKWYLIQIDSVDPRTRKAQCVSGPLITTALQTRGNASQIPVPMAAWGYD